MFECINQFYYLILIHGLNQCWHPGSKNVFNRKARHTGSCYQCKQKNCIFFQVYFSPITHSWIILIILMKMSKRLPKTASDGRLACLYSCGWDQEHKASVQGGSLIKNDCPELVHNTAAVAQRTHPSNPTALSNEAVGELARSSRERNCCDTDTATYTTLTSQLIPTSRCKAITVYFYVLQLLFCRSSMFETDTFGELASFCKTHLHYFNFNCFLPQKALFYLVENNFQTFLSLAGNRWRLWHYNHGQKTMKAQREREWWFLHTCYRSLAAADGRRGKVHVHE